MTKVNLTKEDSVRDVVATLERLTQGEHWMIAMFEVKDDRIELAQRVTWQFPRGDYLEALALLAHDCFNDRVPSQQLPSDPLPLRRVKQLRNILERGSAKSDVDNNEAVRLDVQQVLFVDNDNDGEPDLPEAFTGQEERHDG